MGTYVIGLDYGTDSVRAVLLDTISGKQIATSLHYYERWKAQDYCNPIKNQFRQHPLDHIEGLEYTIKDVVNKAAVKATDVKGITIDTTGSSPLPLAEDGEALAFKKGFEKNPNAQMILWKDHTAIEEAEEINALTKNWGGVDYLKYEGGIYSSEWFWAKILHTVRIDKEVAQNTFTWMEHCDYMTYLLIENKNLKEFRRSRCAAGHKAMWHPEWKGLPAEEFLSQLHPYLGRLRANLYEETYTSDCAAGTLSSMWAKRLGLSTSTVIGVGTFDAHAGAVGARIEEKSLVRVMGTSTCDIIVSSNNRYKNTTVKGICGQVEGSVIPGMIGLEAGLSAFGDVLAWFKSVLEWPLIEIVLQSKTLDEDQKKVLKEEFDTQLINQITKAAASISLEETIPLALDWINGRRTPDANQNLKGAIANLNLGTTAPHLFLSLIHSICFGSKAIVDRFKEEGVEIEQIVGIGGVAKKSTFIMQTLADTLNMPVRVAESEQTSALGAGIYAALAAGLFSTYNEATQVLGSQYIAEYHPNPIKVEKMKVLMNKYTELGISIENLTQ
jgi:L-ribulokinase